MPTKAVPAGRHRAPLSARQGRDPHWAPSPHPTADPRPPQPRDAARDPCAPSNASLAGRTTCHFLRGWGTAIHLWLSPGCRGHRQTLSPSAAWRWAWHPPAVAQGGDLRVLGLQGAWARGRWPQNNEPPRERQTGRRCCPLVLHPRGPSMPGTPRLPSALTPQLLLPGHDWTPRGPRAANPRLLGRLCLPSARRPPAPPWPPAASVCPPGQPGSTARVSSGRGAVPALQGRGTWGQPDSLTT